MLIKWNNETDVSFFDIWKFEAASAVNVDGINLMFLNADTILDAIYVANNDIMKRFILIPHNELWTLTKLPESRFTFINFTSYERFFLLSFLYINYSYATMLYRNILWPPKASIFFVSVL